MTMKDFLHNRIMSTPTNRRRKFVIDMLEESERARDKFPPSKKQSDKLLDACTEELGEVAKALLHIEEHDGSPEAVYAEAVQLASTAMRLAIEGSHRHGYEGMRCPNAGCPQPATGGPCALCYE